MRNFYLLVTTFIFFAACKSASKLYERGNYNDAIDASIKKLQKDPYDQEARDVLKKSYSYAVGRHEDDIRVLSNSSSENKYDQMYQKYNQLQDLYEKIRRYPSVYQFIKPADYSSFVQTYGDKAAETHLEKGDKWMEGEDKRSYREAYREFKAAMRYKPGNSDIKRKLEDAYDAAVVHVLLIPMDAYNSNYYYSGSSYQMRNFQDQIIRNLNYNSGSEFIKFYSEAEARTKRVEPDEVIEMRLGRMNIGQPYDQNTSKQVSKDVVVKEIVHKKDSSSKEYAKVYAKITTTKRTLVSDVEMYLTTREPKGRVLWSDNFRSEHRWQTEFSTYTGDERALSENDKALLDKKDKTAPSEESIADQLLQKLENDIAYRLRNYYTRYQ